MNQIFWIAVGGAIGAVLRYLMVTGLSGIIPSDFPYPTLLVNVTGCLLIGLVLGGLSLHPQFNVFLRPFIVVGILGGFTTFSSYAFEWLILFQKNQPIKALLYFAGSNLLGLAAAWAGFRITQV